MNDSRHLQNIQRALPIVVVQPKGLVCQRYDRSGRMKMTDRHIHVDRLYRIAGRTMRNVHHLCEPEEVFKVFTVAGPTAAQRISRMRRATDT